MTRTRWQTLVLWAVASTAVSALAVRGLADRGVQTPQVPWLVVAVELTIAAVVLSMGWAVRQFLQGRRPDLSPIRAARTAVLAKASCYTGAVLVGWYGGQVLAVVGDLEIEAQQVRAAAAGLAVVGAVVLAVVGLVVEWFCRVPPPEDGLKDDASRPREPSPDPAAG